ncbi:MAG: hypothetical protein CM1200mP27_05600 [Chloroflexota bacterium]|nr:MAG: hypothetical protein CM1200mP27_05600 [Chloroflexota bacterium]
MAAALADMTANLMVNGQKHGMRDLSASPYQNRSKAQFPYLTLTGFDLLYSVDRLLPR